MAILSACGWGGLIAGALATPTSKGDASSNVVVRGDYVYVARSGLGIEVIDLRGGKRRLTAVETPADRVDDLAITDDLLFALDATLPGHLSVYRIDDDGGLKAVAAPIEVPVGPFSGVTAAAGHVIVSGGTSQLTLRNYTTQGELGRTPFNADFGRGQPDVVMSSDGRRALISTHVQGPKFGVTVADVRTQPLALQSLGYVPLDGAGFTAGAFKPANFPLQAAFDGDYALLAHGGGLSVVAIAPGASPTLLATLALPVKATAMAFDPLRHRAYVVGVDPTAEIIEVDVASPASPRLLRRHPLRANGSPTAIALAPHHLVVAMQAGGVHIESR